MLAKIQIRRDNTKNWNHYNPKLFLGEIGYEYETKKFKIGDGVNHWNTLPYQLGQWISDSYGNISYGENPNENDVIIKNNLKVGGDLSVKGTTTFVNTKEMVINDRVITLNWNLDDPSRYDPQLVSGIEVNAGANWLYSDPDEDYKTFFANGIIESFEYDSVNKETKLHLGSLTSRKMSGTVTLYLNSKNVIGTGTSFLSQVTIGSKVLIDGQLYIVGNVFSDTSLSLTSNSATNSSDVDIFTDYLGLSNMWPQNYFNNKVIFLGNESQNLAFPIKRYEKDSDNDPPNPKIILDGDVNKIEYEIYTESDGVVFADDYVRSENFTYKNDTSQDETEILLEREIANWPQDYNYQDEVGQTRKFIKLNKVDFLIKRHHEPLQDGSYILVLDGDATTILPSSVFQIHKNKKQFYWTNDFLNKGWHLDDDFFVDGIVESKNSWEVTPDFKDLYRSGGSVGVGTSGRPKLGYVFDVKDISTQTFTLSITRDFDYVVETDPNTGEDVIGDDGEVILVKSYIPFDTSNFVVGEKVTQIINFEEILGTVVSWVFPEGQDGVLKVQSQYNFQVGNIKNNGGTEFVVNSVIEVINTGDTQVLFRSDNNVYLKLFSDEDTSNEDTASSINLQFYDRSLDLNGLKSTIQWDEATKTFRINYGVSSNKHLILDEDGKVGIGTDIPISLLELAEPSTTSTFIANLKDNLPSVSDTNSAYNDFIPFQVLQTDGDGRKNYYLKVITTDDSEKIILGNKNTDPDIVFDTDGLVHMPTTLAVDALKVGQLEGDKWLERLFKHFGIAAKTSNYGVALGIEQITDDSDLDAETEMWGMGVNSTSDLGFFKNSDFDYNTLPDTLPTPSIIFKSDGKVGIGTTTPTQELQVAGNIKGDETLEIDGATNLNSTLNVLGVTTLNQNLIINSLPESLPAVQKFSVMSETGNTDIAGTLDVLNDVKVKTNKFVITASSGNTNIAGTLDVLNDVRVKTDKFVITASSGNTDIAGTLDVLNDVKVKTNKFVITAETGNTDIAGTLDVTGATTLDSTLDVAGASTLSSTLGVTGATTLSSTLGVTGATTLSSTLGVTGATTLHSTLDVTDVTTLKSDLKVKTIENGSYVDKFVVTASSGDTDIEGTLDVLGASTLSSTLDVLGASTLSSTLDVTGASKLSSTLDVEGDVKVKTNKFVITAETGNTDIAGTLDVTNATTLDSTLNVAGNADLDGTLDVEGDVKVKTNKFVITAETGNTDIAGTLDVTGATTLDSTLDVAGASTLSSTLGVTGATTLSSTLDVTGASTLSSTLDVTGATTLDSTLDVAGASTLSSTLDVTGLTTLKSDLKVKTIESGLLVDKFVVTASSGDTDIEGTLDVAGASTLSSTLDVTGASTLSSTLDVEGDVKVKTNKFVITAETGNTDIAGTLDVTDATTLSSTLDVTGDLKVNGNKFVVTSASGNTNIDGDLGVGIALPSDKVHIDGALRVSNSWSTINTQSGVLDYNAKTTRIITHGDGTDRGGFQVISQKGDGSERITPLSIGKDGNVDFSGSINANNGVVFGGSTSTLSGAVRYNSGAWEGYNGTGWSEFAQVSNIGKTHMTDSAPASPLVGDFWWDTSDGTLRVYYADGDSTQWVTVTSASSDALDTNIWLKEPNNDINYPDGNVGIGTTTPSSLLHVAGTNSGSDLIALNLTNKSTADNTATAIRFTNSSITENFLSGEIAVIRQSDGSNDLRLNLKNSDSTPTYPRILTIDGSTGNVGIGSYSPDSLFEVEKNNDIAYDATDDGGQRVGTATLQISNQNGTTNSFSQILFDTAGTNQSIARIAAIRTGTSSNDLAFAIEGTNTKFEAMRIKSNGNVGIGTNNPVANLEVNDPNSLGVTLDDYRRIARFEGQRHKLDLKTVRTRTIASEDWNDTTYKLLMMVDNTEHQSIDFVSDLNKLEHIDIRTGNQLFHSRFTADGKLGIGTTSPSEKLHVNGGSLRVDIGTTPDSAAIFAGGGSNLHIDLSSGYSTFRNTAGDTSGSGFHFKSINNDLVTIQNDGKVGIGTSEPSQTLTLKDSGTFIAIVDDNDSGAGGILWRTTGGSNYGAITFDPAIGDMTFRSGTNGFGESMTIDSTGRVGIGTSSPGSLLDVRGPLSNSAGVGQFCIGDTNSQYFKIRIDGNGDTCFDTYASGGPWTERITINRTTGNLTIRGRVTEFGEAGSGANVNGSFLSIEGNTDTAGEGSGRLFFREHNSSTVGADSYGLSIGYRGGGTAVTTANGGTWNGLADIGNGEWAFWGHDGNMTDPIKGSVIMGGDRTATRVYINPEVGIGTKVPQEKLDVNGAIRLASTANNNAGTIKYTSNDFFGYNGTEWLSLTSGGSASSYISDTAPTSPEHGDFWWDSGDGELRIYYTDSGSSSQWVTISSGSSVASAGSITDGTSTLTFDSNNNISIDTHIIPDTNAAYDLGSAEYKFRDLYLSQATIYMGDTQKFSAENIDRSMEVYPDPAPVSSTSEGKKGDVRFDDKYMYVCVDTDKWVRTPIELDW